MCAPNVLLRNVVFNYETTIKQARKIYDGQLYDTVIYSMLKSDYFA